MSTDSLDLPDDLDVFAIMISHLVYANLSKNFIAPISVVSLMLKVFPRII
jgi:hypothetical protein